MSIADKAHAPARLTDGEDVATTVTRTVHDPATGAPIAELADGGVKGSGFGKDMSMYALEEHTAVKHVVFELTGASRKDW